MKILTAHQPAYLPWLGLLAKIKAADLHVVLDTVAFEAGSYQNRNKIRTRATAQWLTVPVRAKGHMERPVSSIEIATDQPWARKHWRAIEMHYKRAPAWEKYSPKVARSMRADLPRHALARLSSMTTFMLMDHLQWFGIDTPVVVASALPPHRPGYEGLIDLCQATGCDAFLFGALGPSYADPAAFRAAGITPLAQHYQTPEYPQLGEGFLPNLAAIDALFNLGADAPKLLDSGNRIAEF